jgi:hypothetical protein
MVQVPLAQEAAALANEQGTPQSPQLVRLVTLCSQPLSGSPSQLLKPAAQLGAQSKLPGLPAHRAEPCGLLQSSPQLEQLAAVPSAVSQPGALVQSA